MSRSGYTDDCDDTFDLIRWRGAVMSAIRGKRGQAFLLEMFRAMEALPQKRLIKKALQDEYEDSAVCSLGAVGRARGIDMSKIDADEYEEVAVAFGIPNALAQEIMYLNDEGSCNREDAMARFARVRTWIIGHLKPVDLKDVPEG